MNKRSLSWTSLFFITFLAAYLYVFNEWLFAITRPYFMNDLGFLEQLQIFLSISALLVILCFLALLPLVLLGFLPFLRIHRNVLIKLGALLPAILFAMLILIMVDNFTYTIFQWGVVATRGWQRGLYGLAFIAAVVLSYLRIHATLLRLSRRKRIWGLAPKWMLSVLAVVVLLSVAALALPESRTASAPPTAQAPAAEQLPHILWITADGVDATHMSVYGYERETTPRLQELAKTSLFAENAFSNAGNSPGSVISMYTGKYPAETRVLYPPDILQGQDAYEHLPGILRAQGYKTVQITVPYYLDAKTLNLVDGFDELKMSSAVPSQLLNSIGQVLPINHALFADETLKRIVDRLRHIFYIREMDNPYLEVAGMQARRVDIERWVYLRQEIQSATRPLFVHVHLMVTHGEDFFPMEQKFSVGQSIEDQEPWEDDFYDDAILDFDRNVGELVDDLAAQGLLDKSILIIGSDHGQAWDQLRRLPLLIRFPDEQYAGRIQVNVQNLDIAPTLLDYLGLDTPDWMRGQSLIAGELEQRPILGVNDVEKTKDENNIFSVDWDQVSPPFYQFGGMSLIYCDKWYRLNLSNLTWETGSVEGSTSTCTPEQEITEEHAYRLLVEHLQENGFDVSTLETLTPWSH
ncbi:MAG TPA: sulfatase-like hydrolase/transferase [Anaerolineales bacterium]|nr:sulfatase-like hydrolase/transferase [Anaerolineales bacterium]